MKHHYEQVIADIESRLASTTEALALLDKEHEQLASKRVHLQSERRLLEGLLYDLEQVCDLHQPEPEEPKPFRLEEWQPPMHGETPSWNWTRIPNLPEGIPMP